ncbi:unnamed protein product, partial [Chrysoparadoxa australica]
DPFPALPTHLLVAMGIFGVSEGINYNFVSGAYLCCCLILAALLVLEKQFEVEEVKGTWLVFAPFAPCLLWSLVVRSNWISQRAAEPKDKKE